MGRFPSLFVILLFSLLAPLPFAQSSDSWEDDPYHHIANVDNKGNYVVEWAINWQTRTVLFNVTVRTTGYIGFGVSSTGKMSMADIVIGGVKKGSSKAGPYFFDMHVPAGSRQLIKDKSQDYTLHTAWENGTHTSLSFSREFETCDSHDHQINDDTIKLLWAYGASDNISEYHYQFRGEYTVHLLSPDYTPRELQEAGRTSRKLTQTELGDLRVWTVRQRQRIPSSNTSYLCSIHKAPKLNKKHHAIGFHFRIDTDIQNKHTRNLLLYRCVPPYGEDPNRFFGQYLNNSGEECIGIPRGGRGKMPVQLCKEILYPYSTGMRMFFLPSNVGFALGESPDEYFLLQVHYNNPTRQSNLEYMINIDIFYTPNLKEHDAGIMAVGHEVHGSPSLLIPPMSLSHPIYGHCGSRCTRDMFPKEGNIKIFGIMQHTQYSGIRHTFRHFRRKKELPWIIQNNNHDSHNQFYRNLRSEVKVFPGDHLMAECIYDNTWANGRAIVGGHSTSHEVCVVFFYFYNRIRDYSYCRSEILSEKYNWKHLRVGNLTWSEADLEMVATAPPELAGLTVSEIATNRVEWTEERRKELIKDQKHMPYVNLCPRDYKDGESIEGDDDSKVTEYPSRAQVYKRRNEKETKCPRGPGSRAKKRLTV